MPPTFIARFRLPDLREERGNCFLYGCATLVVLALLGGLVALLAARYIFGQLKENYTEEVPVELPTADYGDGDLQELIRRADTFARDLRSGEPTAPLTLTENEVNVLLQNHPELKDTYGDHVYVTLDGDDSVTTQLSVPLGWIPFMGDRYFNGQATFGIDFDAGRLQLFLTSATLRGVAIPEEQMDEIAKQDLAAQIFSDPESQELVRRVDHIEVKDKRVTLVPVNALEDSVENEDADTESDAGELPEAV